MKLTMLIFALAAVVDQTRGAEFSRASAFDSVESFVASVRAFQPATTKSDLSSLFTVPEMGEGNHGKPITATTIQSCDALWSDDDSALLLTVANPPTEPTRSTVAVLFLLVRADGNWHIRDLLRFTATGKEAKVSAELTAFAGSGYRLGSEGMAPVITVKESHGGRGYSYQSSASYTLKRSKLKRLDLE